MDRDLIHWLKIVLLSILFGYLFWGVDNKGGLVLRFMAKLLRKNDKDADIFR